MEDVQSRRDHREIPVDRVGVSDLRYPIVVLDRQRQKQQTVASVSLAVNLPHQFKGTHMSRFVEILNEFRDELTLRTLPSLLFELKHRLDSQNAHVEVVFPYFMERIAPVSGARSLMDYECMFVADAGADANDLVLGVSVPVTSLCPCSKAISEYGAHNQRGQIQIKVRSVLTENGEPALIWIEELIDVAERSASSPVYPLLKRSDERFVTMQAYDNPVFVEDMVRGVSMALQADLRVQWFSVRAVNHESIHNHAAFAETSWRRADSPPVPLEHS
jgi:GTP cyclohydrolase I